MNYFYAVIVSETARGLQVRVPQLEVDGAATYWLPKREVTVTEYSHQAGYVTVDVPRWLVRRETWIGLAVEQATGVDPYTGVVTCHAADISLPAV